jgi:hypothetical protein
MQDKLTLMIPGPTPVPETVLLAMSRHPIGHRSADFQKIVKRTTAQLKWLHQTSGDVLAITGSGTAALALTTAAQGYSKINRYYNMLASKASADWLFVWNDDALMETTGCDNIVAKHDGEFKLLKIHVHREHPYSIFPILPKEWYDLFGFMSRHQMTDTELSQIAYMLDLMEIVEIYATHDRHDLTGSNSDATYKNRVMLEGNPNNPADFHNHAFNNGRLVDAEKISLYLSSKGVDVNFWTNVKLGKQDPF